MASRVGGANAAPNQDWLNDQLLDAATKGMQSQVEQLLQLGADIHAKGVHGETSLEKAAAQGRSEIVKRLLDEGANPDLKNNFKSTPLHEAAFFGHVQAVRLLLGSGADANAKNRHGNTPLQMALSSKDLAANNADAAKLQKVIDVFNEFTENQTLGWIPERHAYFPRAVRTTIEALLVVWGHKADGSNSHPESPLSTLPLELVFEIADKVAVAEIQSEKVPENSCMIL